MKSLPGQAAFHARYLWGYTQRIRRWQLLGIVPLSLLCALWPRALLWQVLWWALGLAVRRPPSRARHAARLLFCLGAAACVTRGALAGLERTLPHFPAALCAAVALAYGQAAGCALLARFSRARWQAALGGALLALAICYRP